MNCKAFRNSFTRRKKVVVVGYGVDHFYVLDTRKPTKSIGLEETGVRLGPIAAIDGETLLASNGEDTLALIDVNTGEIKASQTSEVELIEVQILVVGNWIYSVMEGFLVRTKKDLIGKRQVSEQKESMRVTWFGKIDGKVASIHTGETEWILDEEGEEIIGREKQTKLVIWNIESGNSKASAMKISKIINIPTARGLYLHAWELDREHLLAISQDLSVSLINIETGEVTQSKYTGSHEYFHAIEAIPGTSGFSAQIFAASRLGKGTGVEYDSVEVFSLDKKGELREKSWELTRMGLVQNILALDEKHVFILDNEKDFEVWEIGRKSKTVCGGSLEGETEWFAIPFPLSERENRQENSRFVKAMDRAKPPVPKEILDVIAGFI